VSITTRLVGKISPFTHPVKEDVKEKLLSLPSRESKARDLHPAPASFLEGFLILPLLFTA
jgi:hypothetical protein